MTGTELHPTEPAGWLSDAYPGVDPAERKSFRSRYPGDDLTRLTEDLRSFTVDVLQDMNYG